MKKLTLFLFILISVFTYAQDTTKVKTKKTKRFFVGVNFSADYGKASIKPGDLWVENSHSSMKFGYTGGLNICYFVTKYFNIDLGFQYSKKNFDAGLVRLAVEEDLRRGGVFYNLANGTSYFNYQFLDIPVKVNFTIGKKKTHLLIGLGLTTNLLLHATSSFSGYDQFNPNTIIVVNSSSTTNNYNRVNLSPTISCGLQYKVNEKIFFRIEPTFRYGLFKMTESPVEQYHFWNAGLNLSWYFI